MGTDDRSSPSDRLRVHVEELVAEHLIRADYSDSRPPAVSRRDRSVVLRPVKGRASYFAALAQIAEIAADDSWAWVVQTAITPPPPAARKLVAVMVGQTAA